MATRREILGGMVVAASSVPLATRAVKAAPAAVKNSTIELWPGKIPGGPAKSPPFHIEDQSKDPAHPDRWLTGIATPVLEVRPASQPNGAAVMLLPGGGYGFLSWDNEGEEQANWLNRIGVTCFILKYRLPTEGWANRAKVPLQDAQRGIRIIRSRAAQFGVDPKRVAIIGFSAGGHLAGSLATRYAEVVYDAIDAADQQSARPDLAGMIYPVVSMLQGFTHVGSRDNLLGPNSSEKLRRASSIEMHVTDDTPPLFLVGASDDGLVPVENSLALYSAVLKHNRKGELHVFDRGGHGFGVRLPQSVPGHVWPKLFTDYARELGVFPA